ncbi:hypothetical protein ACM55G_03365 [Flavobacterium sp. LB3P122]
MRKLRSLIVVGILLFVGTTVFAQKTKVPKEKSMGGYLMVYFKDDTHGL